MIFATFFLAILMSGQIAKSSSVQDYYACVSMLLSLDLDMRQIKHYCSRQVGGIVKRGQFYPFRQNRTRTPATTATPAMTTTATTMTTTTATMTTMTTTITTKLPRSPNATRFDFSPWTIDLKSMDFQSKQLPTLNLFIAVTFYYSKFALGTVFSDFYTPGLFAHFS